jgi:hypothetical protein
MRTFLRAHWKVIVAIIPLVLSVLLALFTVNPGAAVPAVPPAVQLISRLHAHSAAIAAGDRARYIDKVLAAEGYAVRRQPGRHIEVSVANVAPGARPARIFIVGANGSDNGGAAAVLELARLLKNLHPSLGTEVKFVFFTQQPKGRDESGNFIAFVGGTASARAVQDALSAFRAVAVVPARGLAAPAFVRGVTLAGHSSWRHAGYPAIAFTDTGFLRYPYHDAAGEAQHQDQDPADDDSTARAVQGLARTIKALAAGQDG